MQFRTNTSPPGRILHPLDPIPPISPLPPQRQTRRIHPRADHPPCDSAHPHPLLSRQCIAIRRFCYQPCAHQTPVLALDRSGRRRERQLEPGYGEESEAGRCGGERR